MKLSNQFWGKLSLRSPKLAKFSANQQAENKTKSLSGSIIERRTPSWKPLLMILPALFILGTFTIGPFIINIINSFKNQTTEELAFKNFAYNFKFLFEDPVFAVSLRNSLLYAMLVIPFIMSISILISSLISSIYRKVARGIWQTIFFLPYVTNAVAVSLTFIQVFSLYGMFNTAFDLKIAWLESGSQDSFRPLLVLIVKGVWSGLAFNILIFTTAMLSVNKNLYKSASIDGVSEFKQFFTITLPSIKTTTTFLLTMSIIGGIKVFPLALFNNVPAEAVTNGGSSLMLYIYYNVKTGTVASTIMASVSSIALFVIGVLYSSLIRGGFDTIMKVSLNLGENNVWNKIKDSEEISRLKTKEK